MSSCLQAAKPQIYLITPNPSAYYPEERKGPAAPPLSFLRGRGSRSLCSPTPEVAGERGCGGNPGSLRTLRLWRMWRGKTLTWLKAVFSPSCYQPCHGSLALCLAHLSRPSRSTYSSLRPRPGPAQSPAPTPPTAAGARPSARLPCGLGASVRAPPAACLAFAAARVAPRAGVLRGVAAFPGLALEFL